MRFRLFILLLGLAACGRATSVIPPTFPELVDVADGIYRGRVTDIQARRSAAPDGTVIIKTYVTFSIDRSLKGAARPELTLEFLGGTIGDESLVVIGMPKFVLGHTEYLFVRRNGVQFCPLVAMGHGRYRIGHDATAARNYIARENGLPLTDLSEVELPLAALPGPLQAATAAAALPRALSPAAFEAGILAELQRPTARARPN